MVYSDEFKRVQFEHLEPWAQKIIWEEHFQRAAIIFWLAKHAQGRGTISDLYSPGREGGHGVPDELWILMEEIQNQVYYRPNDFFTEEVRGRIATDFAHIVLSGAGWGSEIDEPFDKDVYSRIFTENGYWRAGLDAIRCDLVRIGSPTRIVTQFGIEFDLYREKRGEGEGLFMFPYRKGEYSIRFGMRMAKLISSLSISETIKKREAGFSVLMTYEQDSANQSRDLHYPALEISSDTNNMDIHQILTEIERLLGLQLAIVE